jgi:hypothetical protein
MNANSIERCWLIAHQAHPVIPAKAGIVRLKAHLVREVEVLFRHALSGL